VAPGEFLECGHLVTFEERRQALRKPSVKPRSAVIVCCVLLPLQPASSKHTEKRIACPRSWRLLKQALAEQQEERKSKRPPAAACGD